MGKGTMVEEMSNKFHPGPKPPDIRGDWKLDPKVNDTDVITIDIPIELLQRLANYTELAYEATPEDDDIGDEMIEDLQELQGLFQHEGQKLDTYLI